jgi:hypothetical protein
MDLYFENKDGQRLDLLNNRRYFSLTAAEGLHGVEVGFDETENTFADGSTVDHARALPRGIALKFAMCGDVAASLDIFHGVVKSKQLGKLIKREGERETKIQGRVTVPPYTRHSDAVAVELHLYCPQPYWEDLQELDGIIAEIVDLLYFPEEGRGFPEEGVPFGLINRELTQKITNDGDTSVGMTIVINTQGEVVNPRIACASGEQNGYYMRLNTTLADGDEVIITTHKNAKSITINGLAYKNGVPILSLLEYVGKEWLQLETGENIFEIATDNASAKVFFNIYYSRRWER